MKLLFLDIDGVCNCATTFQQPGGDRLYVIDPAMADRVKRIVAETGCKVVLSSTWRHGEDGRNVVKEKVVDFIGVTRSIGRGFRGDEVNDWIKRNPGMTNYAILDDSSDFYGYQPVFNTDWEIGLTDEITQQVINHLNIKSI